MSVELIRHSTDPLVSIYAGDQHIGFVFPPIAGWSTQYEASPNSLDRKMFDSEQDAIDYVVAQARV